MDTGIIIFADFDRAKKTIKPAIMQKIAVRVPDINIAHVQNNPAIPKKILNFFTRLVIVMMKKPTAAAAI